MILKLSLRGLWARKRRLTGCFVAVFLGVAFLSGGLVLADTLGQSVNRFIGQAYAGTDVVVRNSDGAGSSSGTPRAGIDASLLGTVRQVDGVANAEPVIRGAGQLLGKNGNPLTVLGLRLAGNWITDPKLNPYHLVAGRAPAAGNEVVIDKAFADSGHFKVGDTTTLLTDHPVPVTIVGISKFGDQDAFGGTSFTQFTLAGAERYVAKPGQVTSIYVRGNPGVPAATLAQRVQAVLPAGTQAVTGKSVAAEAQNAVNSSFLNFFRVFLLAFSVIALLVATFSIANTISITVAQRSRESALLRAVGATRRQVLSGVLAEALGIGVIASAVGILGGLGFASLLKLLFAVFGLGLPAYGLQLSGTTVIVSTAVGVVVTLVASLLPAARASRVSPMAALREVAPEQPDTPAARLVTGGVLGAATLVLVLASAFASGSAAMAFTGLAAGLGIASVVLLGPAIAARASALLGAPIAKLRGPAGALARRNALRSRRRTASAATALTIGVTVVTLITVMVGSLETSVSNAAGAGFGGDLALKPASSMFAGYSPWLTSAITRLPQVKAAAGISQSTVSIAGKSQTISSTDLGSIVQVLNLKLTQGSVSGLAVSMGTADSHKWSVGSFVPVTFPDGQSQSFPITAIFESNSIAGSYLFPQSAVAPHVQVGLASTILIKLNSGVSQADGLAAVQRVADTYGASGQVVDREQYVSTQASGTGQLLGIVYVMLALAIIIALLGISNTLSLAIWERTRELGLLHAVGATRRQVKAMIRWESVLIALIGTISGLVLGLVLGWATAHAVTSSSSTGTTFALPAAQLIVILIVGAVAGILAALRPARRAARLDILDAISIA